MFPRFFDANAKSLVKALLLPDLTRRIGCLQVRFPPSPLAPLVRSKRPDAAITRQAGATDVKSHPWLAGLDWAALYERELVAPFIPSLSFDASKDTSNFDPYPESTDEAPLPADLGLLPPKNPFADF